MAEVDAQTTAEGVVDGATGEDDGGRNPGDVELMIFRRIRSLSNVSGRMLRRGPGETFGRMFKDPLSVFSPGEQSEDDDARTSDRDDGSSAEGNSSASDDDPNSSDANLQSLVSHGVAWRDATVQACATLLGKSVDELDVEYRSGAAAPPPTNLAFGTGAQSFEPVPRDFADFVIMNTLKATDATVMQNASSWLFNMMDRTGSSFVLREEFIRYAPFIGPIADAAVAGIVFDELVREQCRRLAEKEAEGDEQSLNATQTRASRVADASKKRIHAMKESARANIRDQTEGLRRRRRFNRLSERQPSPQRSISPTRNPPSESDEASEIPSSDLYPPSVALRYDIWRPFFIAAQNKYYCKDEDWVMVKQELGIDPFEILVKSQGALDHSDLFPTLGKLYLTQRYLIFYAAIGRNHYVARLGSVARVEEGSIPLMMRDSFKMHLDSETKAAIDGITALQKDDPSESASSSNDRGKSKDGVSVHEATLSEDVGKLMRQYTAGRKPLQFSLLEFRETKHRDHWVHLIREMVAAHKLHVQLGFGSSGRAVPELERQESTDAQPTNNGMLDTEEKIRDILESRSLNYTRSPFRNEPSPPLLAVAAHANIARYRALRSTTDGRVSRALLLFTDAERNAGLINWYTESVRAYNNQSGRSWIERALATIRENMDSNDRMYRVKDDEPFDVSKLGDAIGRFAELCSPLVRVVQFISHLFQWRNPPATILAILICLTITVKGWVSYVPACMLFLQALCVVDTKYNWLGLGMGRTESADAERRQANVLKLVAQVHDTLAAAQNVLGKLNGELGKLQALCLWGSEDWQSWVAVGSLCFVGVVLLLIPSRLLFFSSFFFLFFKHFLPPTNPATKFWERVPSKVAPKPRKRKPRATVDVRTRLRKEHPS